MSASNGRPLDATGSRSAAVAPARRTARNQRFAAGSNWLKTSVPAYSRTPVGAPGVATAWAEAAAGSAAVSAAARATAVRTRRRSMPSPTRLGAGSDADRPQRQELGGAEAVEDVERGDVVRDLRGRRGAEQDAGDRGVGEREGDGEGGGRRVELRREGAQPVAGREGGGERGVVAARGDTAGRALRVLAGERAARERRRRHHAGPGHR